MFSRLAAYDLLLDRIRGKGVPASGLEFGSNSWGTIAQRVDKLRAAVDAHASTGGRVILVAHSMGTLVCARFLLERHPAVSGFVSVCGVFGGLRRWTMLGWPIYEVVREMRRETGSCIRPELRALLREPSVPTTIFQADRDEFVKDQSGLAEAVRFQTSVTHNGPVRESRAVEVIAARVAEYTFRGGGPVQRTSG
jgi:pimeloyl-ACP methyl ester carboxylesterase